VGRGFDSILALFQLFAMKKLRFSRFVTLVAFRAARSILSSYELVRMVPERLLFERSVGCEAS
jgi:hypothetical protein